MIGNFFSSWFLVRICKKQKLQKRKQNRCAFYLSLIPVSASYKNKMHKKLMFVFKVLSNATFFFPLTVLKDWLDWTLLETNATILPSSSCFGVSEGHPWIEKIPELHWCF